MRNLRWLAMEDNNINDLWPIYNLKNLTDVMLFNNPITRTNKKKNEVVLAKIKSEGKKIEMNHVEINSIFEMEPSRVVQN